jgi:hypothetical protein
LIAPLLSQQNTGSMTVDSMTQIVENVQSIYTIVLALAIAEAFNQAIKENKPETEKHATTFANWFDCMHHSRFISLIVFLLLATLFFRGTISIYIFNTSNRSTNLIRPRASARCG